MPFVYSQVSYLVSDILRHYFNACTMHILLYLFKLMHKFIYLYMYRNCISLYNVHFCMFRHLSVILMEFLICASLSYNCC
jgi:hypothetical protein